MPDTMRVQHFLDTSVVRSWLLGVQAQQRYFNAEFGADPCYVSRFVRMEFTRSYIRRIIEFLFVLDLPTIASGGDALAYWSEKYGEGRHKAIGQMIGQICQTQRLHLTSSSDKTKIIGQLAQYAERIVLKLEGKFKDTGLDSTRCSRANVRLEVDLGNILDSLMRFVEAFDNKKDCRSRCRIDEFILRRYAREVAAYVAAASILKKWKDAGFVKIAHKLEEVLNNGPSATSCDVCAAIGDAIIALDAPRQMQLEHTDSSFNYLCPPIGQPHKHHPSATAILKAE